MLFNCNVKTNYNYNVIMKRINFNQRQTPEPRDPPEPHAKIPLNACGNWWWLCLYHLVSPPDVARSLLWCLCPLQSLCHALSSGVNHNASARGSTSHLRPLPAAKSGCPVPPMVEGWHSGDSLYYPIQWIESKDETTWEQIWGLGYSGSSLPSCPSLSSDNLLYKKDFPLVWST